MYINILMIYLKKYGFSSSINSVAIRNIKQILERSILFNPNKNKLLVIYDTQSDLSKILTSAYHNCSNQEAITMLDFDKNNPTEIKTFIEKELKESDLVVCIQTGAFYLNDYRLRLELFARNLKNIEHVHLGLIHKDQYLTYIESLGFDHADEKMADIIKNVKYQLENATRAIVTSKSASESCELIYDTPFEKPLLNIGDYSQMKNIGGTFPVGEIFTEPKDLMKLNGSVMVFGFPNIKRIVEIHKNPFKITIENGIITKIDENAPKSFMEVFNVIKENENEVFIREFGLGINPFLKKEKPLNDVTAFERQLGLHLSMGKKHTVFKKKNLKTKQTRYHVDIFVEIDKIMMNKNTLFKN
jgi:aminopeptidase